jgi:Tol biopolymer transport system component
MSSCGSARRAVTGLAVAALTAAAGACGGSVHAEHPPSWRGEILLSQNSHGGSALFALRPGSPPHRLRLGPPAVVERSPAIAPGGRTIAFARGGAGSGSATEIWTASVDGTRARRLTRNAAYDDLPVFSPDGRSVAFASDRGGSAQVWAMPRDGSGARRVTSDLGAAERVSWSPDGARIAYACLSSRLGSGDDADNTDICTISATGRGERHVTPDPVARDSQPAWSPAGGWIAFVRDRADLMAVRPDGTDLHVVRLAGRGGWAYPTWSPTGRSLLVLDRGGLRLRIGNFGGDLHAIARAELTAPPVWWQAP